jgi:succinate dehydrogenase/fumarate reductase flavoprotein subunit
MFNHLVPPNQCGEGQVMALRAGAELAIMEQYPWLGRRVVVGAQRLKNWTRSSPATPSGYPAGRIVNVAGEVMPEMTGFDRSLDKDLVNKQVEWVRKSISEGKLPFYWDATWAGEEERKYAEWASGEEGLGIELWRHFKEDLKGDLSTHQIELDNPRIVDPKQPAFFLITSPSGVVVNTNAASTLRGLYAAGEVAYGQHFPSSPWAFVTGHRAGHSAAQHALNTVQQEADRKQLDGIKEHCFAPLMVKEGHTWQEMNLAINEITRNYILGISPERLKLGLGYLEDLKNEEVQANNAHELMRTWETLSLLAVSEIFCRSALLPRRMTEWRILKHVDGEMKFSTRPIEYKYPIE